MVQLDIVAEFEIDKKALEIDKKPMWSLVAALVVELLNAVP